MAFRTLPDKLKADLLEKTQAASRKITGISDELLTEEAPSKIAAQQGRSTGRSNKQIDSLPTAQVLQIAVERETRRGVMCDKDPTGGNEDFRNAQVIRIFKGWEWTQISR